jgi:hypothetical protein
MAHRTRVLALTALSVLSPLGVDAQSGVLIGVAKPGGYETLWVVRDPARSLHATIPDLLVPRPDGWWRVGTVPICSTEEVEGQAMDVLWRVRTDSTPVIAEICHEVAASDLPFARAAAGDTTVADSLQTMVRCSWSHISIKFVSAEYMAVGETSGQTEACEPRGGRWYQSYYVSRFNGDSSLALAKFATPSVDSLGRVALTRAATELAKDEMCTEVVHNFKASELLEVGVAWYPVRARGRWRPTLMEELGTGDCQLLPTIDVVLANVLTGHDSLHPSWEVLARQVKGLVDAFTSPRGDLVIARGKDSLFVYLADGEKLGRRIGAVSFADRDIVMLQWATGRNVARWNQEIAAMVRRGLPAPKVVPAPKEP